ncbi:homeobox-like protein HDP1 [Bicyclus anynana]|uniref:Homeobox-like protein HDP1 n=1 Tax=Bicyclus anynana TaxID=110368 RepID=A0ABM3M3T0_BICAN|nr:homeobox-like protein HDP1 [Bicyclus anynana]XP_052746148.1 homeobox-like protein HDP1 [Bicyclus anynana]XP_052746149.1 homeobox-like protein HDP1 [Bicyclus anynana]
MSSSTTKKSSPRAMPVETIVTRYKSKQQLQDNKKSKKIQKPQVKNPKQVRKIIKKVKQKPVPVIVIEDDGEFYPQKLKRNVENKKVILKPKPNLKLIGGMNSCNKRKLRMPQKEAKCIKYDSDSSSDIVPYSPKPTEETELSVMDMILLIEEKGLDDEDMLEILTCPSPVWWEDPLDGYIEEPIFTRLKPAQQKSIKNQLQEEQNKEAERRKQRDMDLFLASKDSGNLVISETDIHIENRGVNFVNKRGKLESLLGVIKKIKKDSNYLNQDNNAATTDITNNCDSELNKNNNLITESKSKCIEVGDFNKNRDITNKTNESDISVSGTNEIPDKDIADSVKNNEEDNEIEKHFLSDVNEITSKKIQKEINVSKGDVIKLKSDVTSDEVLNDLNINNNFITKSKLENKDESKIIENSERIVSAISIPKAKNVEPFQDSKDSVKNIETAIEIGKRNQNDANQDNKTKTKNNTCKKKRRKINIRKEAVIKLSDDVKAFSILNLNEYLTTELNPDNTEVAELNKHGMENCDENVDNTDNRDISIHLAKNVGPNKDSMENIEKGIPIENNFISNAKVREAKNDINNTSGKNLKEINICKGKIIKLKRDVVDNHTNKSNKFLLKLKSNEAHLNTTDAEKNIEKSIDIEKNVSNNASQVSEALKLNDSNEISNQNHTTINANKKETKNNDVAIQNKNNNSILDMDVTNVNREKKSSESSEDHLLDLEEILRLENIEIPIAPITTQSEKNESCVELNETIDHQPTVKEISPANIHKIIRDGCTKLPSYNSEEEEEKTENVEKRITEAIIKSTNKNEAKKVDTMKKVTYLRVRKLGTLNSTSNTLAEMISTNIDDKIENNTPFATKTSRVNDVFMETENSDAKSNRRLMQLPNSNNTHTIDTKDSLSSDKNSSKAGTFESNSINNVFDVSQEAGTENKDDTEMNFTDNPVKMNKIYNSNNNNKSVFQTDSEVNETNLSKAINKDDISDKFVQNKNKANSSNNDISSAIQMVSELNEADLGNNDVTIESEVFSKIRRYSTDSATSDKNMSIEYLDMSILDEDETDKTNPLTQKPNNDPDLMKPNNLNNEDSEPNYNEEYLIVDEDLINTECTKEIVSMKHVKHMGHVLIKHQGKTMKISEVKGAIQKINIDTEDKCNDTLKNSEKAVKCTSKNKDINKISNTKVIESNIIKKSVCNSCDCSKKSILISDSDVKYCTVCSSIYDTDNCKYCVKMNKLSPCNCEVYICDRCCIKLDNKHDIIDHLKKCEIVR